MRNGGIMPKGDGTGPDGTGPKKDNKGLPTPKKDGSGQGKGKGKRRRQRNTERIKKYTEDE